MKEKTSWEPKNGSKTLKSSGSGKQTGDTNLMKALLAVAAGVIVAALVKGVKDSDYYD